MSLKKTRGVFPKTRHCHACRKGCRFLEPIVFMKHSVIENAGEAHFTVWAWGAVIGKANKVKKVLPPHNVNFVSSVTFCYNLLQLETALHCHSLRYKLLILFKINAFAMLVVTNRKSIL